LKYIGIALLVGYLFMVVQTLDEQKDDDIPVTERIANAIFGSLYAYIITVVSYIITLNEDITGNNNNNINNNTYGYNIG
jgi:hypothetical protein